VSQKIETSIRQSSLFRKRPGFIYNHGGNVAGIIRDKEGNLIHSFNDQLFVVYEWLYGRDLSFVNADDLKSALHGLAKFHIASKGYVAPEGAKVSSKLGRWPEQYKSMADKLSPGKKHPGKTCFSFCQCLSQKC